MHAQTNVQHTQSKDLRHHISSTHFVKRGNYSNAYANFLSHNHTNSHAHTLSRTLFLSLSLTSATLTLCVHVFLSVSVSFYLSLIVCIPPCLSVFWSHSPPHTHSLHYTHANTHKHTRTYAHTRTHTRKPQLHKHTHPLQFIIDVTLRYEIALAHQPAVVEDMAATKCRGVLAAKVCGMFQFFLSGKLKV